MDGFKYCSASSVNVEIAVFLKIIFSFYVCENSFLKKVSRQDACITDLWIEIPLKAAECSTVGIKMLVIRYRASESKNSEGRTSGELERELIVPYCRRR